jgi:hypothetical protein
MLALVHQTTISASGQQATIALPDATPMPLWVWVNSSTSVDQRTIVEIPTSQIPKSSGSVFQPTLQLYAPGAGIAPYWTISSLAVLGIP